MRVYLSPNPSVYSTHHECSCCQVWVYICLFILLSTQHECPPCSSVLLCISTSMSVLLTFYCIYLSTQYECPRCSPVWLYICLNLWVSFLLFIHLSKKHKGPSVCSAICLHSTQVFSLKLFNVLTACLPLLDLYGYILSFFNLLLVCVFFHKVVTERSVYTSVCCPFTNILVFCLFDCLVFPYLGLLPTCLALSYLYLHCSVAESKEKNGVWDPMSELTITSPYVESRVDFNLMPESILALCLSRVSRGLRTIWMYIVYLPESATVSVSNYMSSHLLFAYVATSLSMPTKCPPPLAAVTCKTTYLHLKYIKKYTLYRHT